MIGQYERLKKKLIKNTNQFILTDDMFYLTNALSAIYEIMRREDFPIEEYAKKHKKR